MAEIEDFLKDAEILRTQMEKNNGNLTDTDVVAASKVIKGALDQYKKFIGEKLK